jgi:hypothetical protein
MYFPLRWHDAGERAGPIIGFSLGYMNLLNCLAVYATICKVEGLTFR